MHQKDMRALTSPNATPMAAEAKNMRQNLPTAVKNAAPPLTSFISGDARSITVLKQQIKVLVTTISALGHF